MEGFRGGLDEKMRRMWFGREVVVAGLPPLITLKLDMEYEGKIFAGTVL